MNNILCCSAGMNMVSLCKAAGPGSLCADVERPQLSAKFGGKQCNVVLLWRQVGLWASVLSCTSHVSGNMVNRKWMSASQADDRCRQLLQPRVRGTHRSPSHCPSLRWRVAMMAGWWWSPWVRADFSCTSRGVMLHLLAQSTVSMKLTASY